MNKILERSILLASALIMTLSLEAQQTRMFNHLRNETLVKTIEIAEIDSITFSKFTPATDPNGIEINGIKWATANMAAPGAFAANPWEAGMFYQWNRSTGWTATDPRENNEGGTTWNTTSPGGSSWTAANDPCPNGWRLPTAYEQQDLISSGGFFGTFNGINGWFFGNGKERLFFPAIAYRAAADGSLCETEPDEPGNHGRYWSSTVHPTYPQYAYSLFFYGKIPKTGMTYTNHQYGNSVRCVAEQFKLTYNTPNNGTLTVTTGGSPIANNADLYYGSVLTITAMPAAGYKIASLTVNGAPVTSGDTYTVVAAVNIACTFTEIEAVLTDITVNNIPLTVDNSMFYMAPCGTSSVELDLAAEGSIKVNGENYTGVMTVPLSNDKTDIIIVVTSQTYTLTIAKALGSATMPMYVQRWGKALAVVNNPANNGGHTFDIYKWFYNGTIMPGSTGGYILLEGRPASEYTAEVHSMNTDIWHQLCADVRSQPQKNIVAYPNPVKAGEEIYLSLPEGIDKVNVSIFDINGNLKKHQSGVQQSVSMPNQSGIFILQIQLPDGGTEIQRIIVE